MKIEIISRETIKPSTPTPSHLHSYNLSELDLLIPNFYIPTVVFYSNNNDDADLTADLISISLKKSLSHILTQYYPFAGRFPEPQSPYIDCNDNGLLFLEARINIQLVTFRHMINSSSRNEILNKLFADDLVTFNNTSSTNPVAVQLTRFSCGGLALTVSLAHCIGDVCTLSSFLSHWASVTRYGSINHTEVLRNNPNFIQSPRNQPPEDRVTNMTFSNKFVLRKFFFNNSRLSDLKKEVATGSVNNPTRFEVLTSLLYKTAVAAATAKSGFFKPSCLIFSVNVRERFVPKLSQSTVGNFVEDIMIETRHASETFVSTLIAQIRKKKQLLDGSIQSMEKLVESTKLLQAKLRNEDLEPYLFTSQCGYNFNKLDFGWGNPVGVTDGYKGIDDNIFLMMDTANGDGIEVMISLEKECMEIFENDKEMLSYC